ncbi:hypothetical protein OUZ56_008956 [Daphnia magna]|uniref:Uncharacterized protein n=1 Tax=Daphnia magna TaxID=35525 RepID=A0ABR0AEJ6_9CRUS|nr:hypothetical protein OUZ56_008956 [Daphnia magna]
MKKPPSGVCDQDESLEEQKDNNGRLGRWAILLAGTNYKIKYRPGLVHQNADCLSRLRIAHIQTNETYPDIKPGRGPVMLVNQEIPRRWSSLGNRKKYANLGKGN